MSPRVGRIRDIVKAIRPHQWTKNLFVAAPILFAQKLQNSTSASQTALAFVAFSAAASSIYILNDLLDIESDRQHPIKRNRPIASGRVSKQVAKILGLTLLGVAAGLCTILGTLPSLYIGAYLILNLGYTWKLKHIAFADVLCIAAGFELRVLTGSAATHLPLSTYILVVTPLIALFLALGKRLHELRQVLDSNKKDLNIRTQRKALKGYSTHSLWYAMLATATASFIAYAIYTLDPHTHQQLGTKEIPWTLPFAAIGIFRFFQLVKDRPTSESPTEEMLTDPIFLVNGLALGTTLYLVLY